MDGLQELTAEGQDDADSVDRDIYRKLDTQATSYLRCFKCEGPLIEGKHVLFCRICDIVYELQSKYAHGKFYFSKTAQELTQSQEKE